MKNIKHLGLCDFLSVSESPLSPVGSLEGEPLRVLPSNASLPPLLGHLEVSCDQRGIPLGTLRLRKRSRTSPVGSSRRKSYGAPGYGSLRGDLNAYLKSHIWRCFLKSEIFQ